jgi:CHAD domain-containing protein
VKSSVRIRAALAEQRGRLAEYRIVATERDVRRCHVATRRLRTIARATRPLLGDLLVPVQAELGWLAGVLGPVQDLDVLLLHLRPQVETLDDDVDGAKLVVAALERQRLFRVKELMAAIESQRYDTLLESLDAVVEAVPRVDEPLEPLASLELRRLRRAAELVDSAPSDEEIHALSRRATRARYTAELAGASVRRIRALKRVQGLAGTRQDAVAAEERLRTLSRPKAAVAVGRLIERERFRKGAQRAALPAALKAVLRA